MRTLVLFTIAIAVVLLGAKIANAALIEGGPGNDTLIGTSVADTIRGFGGSDDLRGNGGNDLVEGGSDQDFMTGGVGCDTLNGGPGPDDLYGGNTVAGCSDTLNGNSGNDVVSGVNGRPGDKVFCGDGDDIAYVDSNFGTIIDQVSAECETVVKVES